MVKEGEEGLEFGQRLMQHCITKVMYLCSSSSNTLCRHLDAKVSMY